MCFSAEASIVAYVIGSLLGYILYRIGDKYDKTIAVLTLLFIQMQLAEYLIWINQDCGLVNRIGTGIAQMLIIVQPILIILIPYLFKTLSISKNLFKIILIIYVLFTAGSFIFSLIIKGRFLKYCTLASENGYLDWGFTSNYLYIDYIFLIFYFCSYLILLFFKNKFKGFFAFFIILFNLFYSFIIIKNQSFIEIFKQWESKWCFTATFLPLFFIALHLFDQKKR